MRFARFVLVGCLATGIQYAVLVLLVRAFGTDPTLASALGFVLSASVNYIVNYHYTFESSAQHGTAAIKFGVLALVGLLINSALMHALVAAGWHYLLAQVCTTAVVLVWNFAGNSLWTFRTTAGDTAAPGVIARNKDIIAILLLTAVIRATVFLLSDNESGDADARAIISGAWAHDPTLILAGVWLPFHMYATGILTWIFGSSILGGKVLAWVTGSLSIIPLFLLTQLLFDRRTALIAGLMFAVYGLHVELSSVVMSEAPCALFMIWAVYVFLRESRSQSPRLRGFLFAGVLLAIAGGFRQEPWLLTGILGLYMLLKPALRRYTIAFGLVGFSTLISWDIANATADQGPLHALTAVAHSKAIEATIYHFSVVHNLLKWVVIFVRSPGPLIAALAVVGLVLAFRRRLPQDLAWIAVLLLAPFVALSVLKPEWAPQDRYMVFFGILVLPYAAAATVALLKGRNILGPAVATIIVTSIAMQCAVYFWRFHGLLPVPGYNVNDVTAWKWLSANAGPGSTVIVEDIEWRAPGLIAHAALYDHPYHMVYAYKGPEDLREAMQGRSRPLLLVLHSPTQKWPFLSELQSRVVFQNPDYRILDVESGNSP